MALHAILNLAIRAYDWHTRNTRHASQAEPHPSQHLTRIHAGVRQLSTAAKCGVMESPRYVVLVMLDEFFTIARVPALTSRLRHATRTPPIDLLSRCTKAGPGGRHTSPRPSRLRTHGVAASWSLSQCTAVSQPDLAISRRGGTNPGRAMRGVQLRLGPSDPGAASHRRAGPSTAWQSSGGGGRRCIPAASTDRMVTQ